MSENGVQLVAKLVELALSLGFLGLVWRIAWALRGWTEAQKSSAETQAQLVKVVADFVATQKETNRQNAELLRGQGEWILEHMREHRLMDGTLRGLSRYITLGEEERLSASK